MSPGLRSAAFALAGAAVAALAAGGVAAAPVAAEPGDMSLGDPKAKVTVIEYASVGCPHCADWANNVFPELRKRYIDTGQVRFVFREVLTGDRTLAVAGFLTARCAGPARYFQVIDDIFGVQAAGPNAPGRTLYSVAEQAGLSKEQFLACVNDQAASGALQTRTAEVAQRNHVTGTPTFVIGEEKLEGEQTLDQIAAAIARAKGR